MRRKLIYLISFVLVLSIAGIASADLVAHWKFDEGSGSVAHDTSGNNHDGTFEGNPQWVAGYFGGALEFDGDSRVEIPDPSAFDFNADFTWCAWIKTDEGGVIVAETQGEDDQGPKTFFVANGTLAFDTGWVGFFGGTTAVNDGQWHHVAVTVTFNGDDTIQYYIDGEPGAQGQMNVDSFPEAEFPLWIGFDGRA
ncbi:MAG: LamG domain-containing protein, partial [Desulfobacterales bacterium]|nr:LamG domain-containing protein [Desulfobacterales bacterium]